MNQNPIKIVSLATICMCALALLGIVGTASPVFAAAGIAINGGAQSTNYHQVTLALTAPAGSVNMSLRNDSLAWSAPETVTAVDPAVMNKAWTLSEGDGDKKVTVQFTDAIGNPTGLFNATIKLGYILDRSFFGKGYRGQAKVPGTIKTAGHAVAVQADQKIVVVGTVDLGGGNSNMEVIRYLPNGDPDPGFAQVSPSIYGVMDYPGHTVPGAHTGKAVALDSLGRIIVVGTYDNGGGNTDLWVMRLNPDGTPDLTFTGGPLNGVGTLKFDGIGGADSGNAVAIDSFDRIVLVGTYDKGGANGTTPWVIRLNETDGSLDTDFNGTGSTTFDAAAGAHKGNAVAIDSNDYAVVVGTYDHGGGFTSVWTLRLDDTGVLDTTFGGRTPASTGENTYGAFGAHTGNAVAINPNTGKISVVGTYDWSGGDTDIWLLQLDGVDGTLDTSFNPASEKPGTITLGGVGSGLDAGGAVAIQPDDKIVVVGTYDNIGSTSLLVQRINSDSSLDTTFNNGTSAYAFGQSGRFTGNAVALQADNKIVVAGMGDSLVGTSLIQTVRLHGHTFPLTVSITSSGTVAANLGSLNFTGPTGSGNYVPNTLVQLTATPFNGASFAGWGGACAGTGPCTVTMDAAKSVTANFTTTMLNLNVTVIGTGSITVCVDNGSGGCSSSDTCPSGTCTFQLPYGSPLVLTPTTAWYTNFVGWGGDCSGNGTCTPAFTQERTVYSGFNPQDNVMLQSATPIYYPTLQSAYQPIASLASATYSSLAMDFAEGPLSLDRPVTFTIDGGKDAGFTTTSGGYSTLLGSLKVSNGRVNVIRFKIK